MGGANQAQMITFDSQHVRDVYITYALGRLLTKEMQLLTACGSDSSSEGTNKHPLLLC